MNAVAILSLIGDLAAQIQVLQARVEELEVKEAQGGAKAGDGTVREVPL